MKKLIRRKVVLLAIILIAVFNFNQLFAHLNSFSSIVKSERNKVVHITTSSIVDNRHFFNDPFFEKFFKNIPKNMPKKKRESALGSGFFISHDGYILTNNHVVARADKIEVVLFNDKKYNAKVVGNDKMTDLALLKIDIENHDYAELGDSDELEVGDWVLAIGNPLGLDHSVTSGIISAKERGVFGNSVAYGQFLQTDAAINPGNSGGPLYNMDGKVVGINSAIVASGQGLGFAIPSNLAKKIFKQLMKNGKVVRGYFGVIPQELDEELAKSFGLPEGTGGIILTRVDDDTPAYKAGLKQGDIIVEIEGKKIIKEGQFRQYIAETMPGESLSVKVFRQGKFFQKSVKVSKRPDDEVASFTGVSQDFGMQLVKLNNDLRSQLDVNFEYGLYVYDVDPTEIAWEKGIRKGDIILEARNNKLKSNDDFQEVVKECRKLKIPVNLLVYRNGNVNFVALPIDYNR
ncbi:MAG: Do family serine endopeptidase [Deltaproteobacteria bacterium]|nr:Do family serine endopeptidase [Deltaproteobacteria bacterium]MBT4525779.1 Do family serine endopeptidase [Deltaproteobacteria bacterium]